MDGFIHRVVPGDEAVAEFINSRHRPGGRAHLNGAADLHALTRPNETAPVEGVRAVHPKQFDSPVVGKKAGRDDSGVVEDEEIILPDEGRKVAKPVMRDCAFFPVDHHHPGGRSFRQRVRSDKVRGEIVIKVFGMHEKWSLEDSLPIRSPATVKITAGARKVLLVTLQADLSGGVLKQGDSFPPQGGGVLKPCSYEGVLSAVLLIGGQEEKR